MSDTELTDHTDAIPFGDDDPRALFARAVEIADDVIVAIRPEHHRHPTPSGMEVGDLLEHLVMVLRRVASAGRGEDPWTWPVDAGDVPADGWHRAWQTAAQDVRAAWDDEDLLDRATVLPWGTYPGSEVLAIYANEVTVHTWDLAVGTGQQPTWDQRVLEICDAAIRAQLPMADRTPMWEAVKASLPADEPWEDPFGPAVEVPEDAPLIERLVAWNGRDPRGLTER